MDRNDMQSFASNIRNAPHLTQLTFRYATMNLGDMEQLHANLPKLEILSLGIRNENYPQEIRIENAANSVKSLTLTWDKIELGDRLIKWIIYIRKKYPNLEVLKFNRWRLDKST